MPYTCGCTEIIPELFHVFTVTWVKYGAKDLLNNW